MTTIKTKSGKIVYNMIRVGKFRQEPVVEFPDQKQRTAVCFEAWRKKGETMKDEKKFDEKGREIVAENVPFVFGATIEVDEDGTED